MSEYIYRPPLVVLAEKIVRFFKKNYRRYYSDY
jgi:hypothetical protein